MATELGDFIAPDGSAGPPVNTEKWSRGPSDPSGHVVDLSHRPILCGAVSLNGQECTFGGADHALYCVDTESCGLTRSLYGPRAGGHKDWVTSVAYAANGLILSGGMDGSVCLWDAPTTSRSTRRSTKPPKVAPRSQNFTAHAGSVSTIKTDTRGHAVSASYGEYGEVKVWKVTSSNIQGLCELSANEVSGKSPAMDLAWSSTNGNAVAAGYRSGYLYLWDVTTQQVQQGCKAHTGHVTCVISAARDVAELSSCLISGGQDGYTHFWDTRSPWNATVASLASHRRKNQGVGSVGGIIMDGYQLISYGADTNVVVTDMRSNRSAATLSHHQDFIYCMGLVKGHRAGKDLLFTGAGDGMLLCYDLQNRELQYGLGCTIGAVRCLNFAGSKLFAAGDDGNVTVYWYT
jgi:WD40 repeat protein